MRGTDASRRNLSIGRIHFVNADIQIVKSTRNSHQEDWRTLGDYSEFNGTGMPRISLHSMESRDKGSTMSRTSRTAVQQAVLAVCALFSLVSPQQTLAQSELPILPSPDKSTSAEQALSSAQNEDVKSGWSLGEGVKDELQAVSPLPLVSDPKLEELDAHQSAPFDRSGSVLQGNRNRSNQSMGSADTANAYPTLNWSGFLQVETGWLIQDEANVDAFGAVTPSTGLRRVRLRVDGNVQETTSYVVDLDFAASGHPSFRNVGLTFHEVPTLQVVETGLLKTPFGMDAMTSGRELLFLERQLPFALVPFRQIMMGARGNSKEKKVAWGAAAFRMPTNSFGVYEGGNGGIGFAGRLTTVPLYRDNGSTAFHLGGGYSVGSPGDGALRYRIQPGFFTRDPGSNSDDPGTVPVFLDTGDMPTDLFNLWNIEVGANLGSFHIASEMRWSMVDQTNGPNVVFPGFYVQVSYVLTGEHHRYSRTRGVFERIIPDRPFERGKATGFGAIEAAIGYSTLNLNDGNISGGRGETLALGLNWYLTRNAKLQFTVQPGRVHKAGFADSSVVLTAIRAQVEF